MTVGLADLQTLMRESIVGQPASQARQIREPGRTLHAIQTNQNNNRINKQWEVIALEQLTSHIERRPTNRGPLTRGSSISVRYRPDAYLIDKLRPTH